MLNYEQFKEQFIEDLKKNLEDQGIKVEKVEVIPNEKLQEGPCDAVTVRLEDSIVGPSGNLTDVFDAYERGGGSISLFYGSVIWRESLFWKLMISSRKRMRRWHRRKSDYNGRLRLPCYIK